MIPCDIFLHNEATNPCFLWLWICVSYQYKTTQYLESRKGRIHVRGVKLDGCNSYHSISLIELSLNDKNKSGSNTNTMRLLLWIRKT